NQTADCAAIAAGVAVLPFSFTAHAYDIYSTAPRQRNATLDWKLRHAARIFAVSRYARDLLRGRLSAADQGRVCTAYVGIPTALFRLEPQPADASELRLLCVARFQEKKGLDTLIDACALLRDRGVRFHLRLIGDGPQRDELRTQVTRLGLDGHVELPGPMPQEDVARALRDCHVFVMPCRRDRTGDMDGIPTVFMEALASGRPVVSCAVSGVPELVRDGETGLLVPPDAPAPLADAGQRPAADPARLGRPGPGGAAARPGSERAAGGRAAGRRRRLRGRRVPVSGVDPARRVAAGSIASPLDGWDGPPGYAAARRRAVPGAAAPVPALR